MVSKMRTHVREQTCASSASKESAKQTRGSSRAGACLGAIVLHRAQPHTWSRQDVGAGAVASLASLASTDGRMRRCLKRTVILNNIIIIDEQTGHHDMMIYDVHLHGCIYHADVIMLLPRHPSR